MQHSDENCFGARQVLDMHRYAPNPVKDDEQDPTKLWLEACGRWMSRATEPFLSIPLPPFHASKFAITSTLLASTPSTCACSNELILKSRLISIDLRINFYGVLTYYCPNFKTFGSFRHHCSTLSSDDSNVPACLCASTNDTTFSTISL